MSTDRGASESSVKWAEKLAELYRIAMGDKSAIQKKHNSLPSYPNVSHIMESAEYCNDQPVYKPDVLAPYSEQRRSLQDLWLSECEKPMTFEPSHLSYLPPSVESEHPVNKSPSRTTWQGLDPKRHSNHVPLRSGITDRGADQTRATISG